MIFWQTTKSEKAEKEINLKVFACPSVGFSPFFPFSTFWHNYRGIFVDLQHVFPVASTNADDSATDNDDDDFNNDGGDHDEAVVPLEMAQDVAHNCHSEYYI